MLKILMLDLENTLVQSDKVMPHVLEVLPAINSFHLQDGSDLISGLIAEYKLAQPFTQPRVDEIFTDFINLLTQLGLARYFEPITERVTLSTHANARKPDRRLFSLALKRLGADSSQHDCLFISGNAAYSHRYRRFGVDTLLYGVSNPEIGFDDWSIGVMLIAHRFSPYDYANLKMAFPVWARAQTSWEHVVVVDVTAAGELSASGHCWFPITGIAANELDGIHAQVPVDLCVSLDHLGLPQDFTVFEPDEETLREVSVFIEGLAVRRQIADTHEGASPGQTHYIDQQSNGKMYLRQRAFN